ncbi:hypothetical protein SLEP1_g46719 [Rubroshorea leprosula]|uniref:PGG domain-containing protein n=1 Tax=Rubroshorea leprosula TaxID=152421 RepID=A0AAV5LPT6_9ROSI|nr:hypothetical protein SLEP1_g46719 [Rubroshorea leprosula]
MEIVATHTNVIVPEVLRGGNYKRWSILMRYYLLGQDLWNVVQPDQLPAGGKMSSEWTKKNALALHAIMISCGKEIFNQIKEKDSAKEVWDALADMHKPQIVHQETVGRHPERRTGPGNLERSQYETLIEAISNGELWKVKKFFRENSNAVSATAIIFENGYTALHFAVYNGQEEIVDYLIDSNLSLDQLEIKDNFGSTALSIAARYGIGKSIAKKLVRKNQNLLTIEDEDGKIPVELACSTIQEKMIGYLYRKTPQEFLKEECGFYILQACITRKMFGIWVKAYVIKGYEPRSFVQKIGDFYRSCKMMVQHSFQMGQEEKQERIFQRKNQERIQRKKQERIQRKNQERIQRMNQERKSCLAVLLAFIIPIVILQYLVILITELDQSKAVEATFQAIQNGIPDIVKEIIKANANNVLLCNKDPEDPSRNIFACAIAHRQEEVAHLLYKSQKEKNMLFAIDEDGNNILHLAAKLAPNYQSGYIYAAALQLQSELRWFKSVKEIVPVAYKEGKNKDNETPSEVFVREHKDLLKEAEEWVKKTAESSTVVGALIITIMFAVALTVPGGNDQITGFPVLLHKTPTPFMIFMVSDAISLFTATSSVIMFLGILTSHHSDEDYRKTFLLIIGLTSLFVSIATMTTAFCAALFMMLQGQGGLGFVIPITLFAGIPIVCYVLLQFPLLVEILGLTFSSNIFGTKRISSMIWTAESVTRGMRNLRG